MNEQDFEYLVSESVEGVLRKFTKEAQATVMEQLAYPIVRDRITEMLGRLDEQIALFERAVPQTLEQLEALKPGREELAAKYRRLQTEARSVTFADVREEEMERALTAAYKELERVDAHLKAFQRDYEQKRGRLTKMRDMRAGLRSQPGPDLGVMRDALIDILKPE